MTTGHGHRDSLGAAGRQLPAETRLHTALAYLPYVLLAVSFGVTAMSGTSVTSPGELPWIAALTAVALAYRLWWHLSGASRPWRVAGFTANIALTAALISFSPLYGIYAFVGYLDAVALFAGPGQVLALVATASLNALAQSGGPDGVRGHPLVFALLLVVNGGLAVAMVQVDRNRQRTVTRLAQALADLQEAERVNKALQEQVIDQARTSGVLEERQRLSREIHDTVAQGLIALLRQIEAASEGRTLADARSQLACADATARESLAEARRAVHALASPRLDNAELSHALQALTGAWSEATGSTASFRTTGTPSSTPHDADLLRVCQEGLANIAKHAAASQTEICLSYAENAVELTIRDNGVGFTEGDVHGGHGLSGMRDRVGSAGGVLTVETSEGGGCMICAAIPR